MMEKLNAGMDWFIQIAAPFFFAFLALNAVISVGRSGYSTKYAVLYGGGGVLCIVMSLLAIVSLGKKFNDDFRLMGLEILFTSETAPYRLLSDLGPLSFPVRLGLPILFAILIGALVFSSSGAFKVWDTPEPFTAEKLSISNGERLMHQALIPAFVEDYLFAIVFPSIMMIVFGLIFKLWFGINITDNKIVFTILLIGACAFSSLGYGGVIAGFASAHESVQGSDVGFYLFAWVFQTINSLIMQLTGLFMPLAHFTNNALLAVSLSIGVVIAGSGFMAWILPDKYLVRNNEQMANMDTVRSRNTCRHGRHRSEPVVAHTMDRLSV